MSTASMLGSTFIFKEIKLATGKIIKLSSIEQGYGFIVSKDHPCERIYFHWSNLVQNTLRFPKLKNRMEVEFDLRETPDRGLRAYRVRVIEDGTGTKAMGTDEGVDSKGDN